jgi:hypothetical protein
MNNKSRWYKSCGYGATLLALSGCTQARYYPLCVFGPDPKISTQSKLHEKITSFVKDAIGADAKVSIAPNDRYVVIEALEHQHEALSVGWARVACVGQTRFDVEFRQYKACTYLISAAFKNGGLPPLGDWSDGLRKSDTIYCGQSVGELPAAVPVSKDAGKSKVNRSI